MKPSRAVLLSLLLVSAVAQADSVWAPGVTSDGGWVDFNKADGDKPYHDDSLMCWAASSSNIITWWQNQNSKYSDTIPTPDYTGSTWDFFRTITTDSGSNPRFALGWYVNGSGGNTWTWDESNSTQYQSGGFLQSVYCTADNPVYIANRNTSASNTYAQAAALVGALDSGYAMTLEVGIAGTTGNVPSSHAITLWGLDYTSDKDGNISITDAYITDSDDAYSGIVDCKVKHDGNSIILTPNKGDLTQIAYTINRADGMNANGYLDPTKTLVWNADSGSGDRYVTRDAVVTGTANLGNLIFNDSSTVKRTDSTSCISGNGSLTVNNGTVVFDGVSRTGTSGNITINAGTTLELKNGAKMYSDTTYNSSSVVSVHGTLKVESLEYGEGNLGKLRENLGALDLYNGARVEISGANTEATIGVTMYGDKAQYTIALADNSRFNWMANAHNLVTAVGAADNTLVLETGENATFSLGKSVSGALSLHKTGAGRLEIQGGINLDSNSEVQVLGGTMHIAETASITSLGKGLTVTDHATLEVCGHHGGVNSLRVENAKVQGSVNSNDDGARIAVASSVTLSNACLRDVQLCAAAASLSAEEVALTSAGPALTSENSSYIFNDTAPVVCSSGDHAAYIISPVLSGFSTIDGALTLGITMDFMQGVMERLNGQINYLELALLADGMAAGQNGFTITLDAATQAMLDASTLVKYGFYKDGNLLGTTSTGQMKELGVVNFCVYELSELVPEPTSATLSLLALAALAVRRRRC
ncbi:MAG: IdeS/Mac family cysteine endopeptidase [Akkermansia sp.]|nr:IdeS/Mac family cysteine endopeptidase [Akkermansia sp.]